MKKYYIIGAVAAVVLFAFTIAGLWIARSVYKGRMEDMIDTLEEESVVLRYYEDENTDKSRVVYMRVLDTENYKLDELPEKKGYIFVGLFDTKTNQQYVTSDGYGIVPLTESVLLYAKFQKVQEAA